LAEQLILPRKVEDASFAVIGAGNGGQAIAGFLALRGYTVRLWNRSPDIICVLNKLGGITLEGKINGFSRPHLMTADIRKAVTSSQVIMVTVPASGHREVAKAMAPWLTDGQIVVLNPGRTGGALEFRKVLMENGCKSDVTIAEAGTFIYACRAVEAGRPHIFGTKHKVPVAALPATRTVEVVRVLKNIFPQFVPVESVLVTSFDNIGAIFHPVPTILNAGRIENKQAYEHYKEGITASIGRVLEALDHERLSIARAFGVPARSALRWMHDTYGVKAKSIREAVHKNHSYEGIYAPMSLHTRYIFEDVPFSLVPLVSLARIAKVKTPLMRAAISMASALHGVDYWAMGRKAQDMGIAGLGVEEILRLVSGGVA